MFICWYLWKWRNQFILMLRRLFLLILGRLFSLLFLSGARLLVVVGQLGESAISFGLGFSWDCSGQHNLDGSHKAAFGNIGAGGVLRNSNREWLGGFAVNLGKGQTSPCWSAV